MKNASLTLAVLRRPPSLNYCHALISPRSSLTLRLLRRLLKSEFFGCWTLPKKKNPHFFSPSWSVYFNTRYWILWAVSHHILNPLQMSSLFYFLCLLTHTHTHTLQPSLHTSLQVVRRLLRYGTELFQHNRDASNEDTVWRHRNCVWSSTSAAEALISGFFHIYKKFFFLHCLLLQHAMWKHSCGSDCKDSLIVGSNGSESLFLETYYSNLKL